MSKFAVRCPEAGEDAILCFTIDDMERLEELFGESYVATIFADLDRVRVGTIKKTLEIGLKAGDRDQLLRRVYLNEVATRIADALYLTIHGRRLTDAAGEGGEKVPSPEGQGTGGG